VRIGLVAVHALRKRDWFLEVATGVTLAAIDARVFALEREFRFRVIEPLADRLERDLLPTARVVARLTALRKAAMMRVFVTIRTLVERNPDVLRIAIRAVRVTLRALNLHMLAGQRITCLRVIKLANADRFPILEIVAGLASRSQASLVLILVAGNATRGKAEVSPAQVLGFDRRAFLGRNMRRVMTLVAGKSSVLALEQISSLFVVEALDVPFDEREIFAIVLGVAAGAFLAGAGRYVVRGMQTLPGGKPCGDLVMAFQTFQRGLPSKLVAAGAVGRSV